MRATVKAVLLAMVIGGVACGDDSEPVDPAKEAAAVGTYQLSLADGIPLPYKYFQSDTSRFDIIAGKIVLEANHDLTDETTTAETRLSDGTLVGAEAVQRYLGKWAIRGDSIRLSYPGRGTAMAFLEGNTLTLASSDHSLTYTK